MPPAPKNYVVLRSKRPIEVFRQLDVEKARDANYKINIARKVAINVERIDRYDRDSPNTRPVTVWTVASEFRALL